MTFASSNPRPASHSGLNRAPSLLADFCPLPDRQPRLDGRRMQSDTVLNFARTCDLAHSWTDGTGVQEFPASFGWANLSPGASHGHQLHSQ
jgi:hypothetical protein